MGITPGALYITDPSTGQQVINPYGPAGSPGGSGGAIQTTPQTMSQFKSVAEAIDAYNRGQLQGSNVPLSAYLANVAPQNSTGVAAPLGTKSTDTATSTQDTNTSGTGTSNTSGTGSSNSTTTRTLPPEIEAQLNGFISNLLGKNDYGYTPQEIAAMQINPNESRGLVSQALQPTVGAANAARQQGLMAAAARGNYAPGLNSTLERIQQQQGQQAGQIASQTRLGISAQNRDAAIAAANARLNEAAGVRGQIGGLLQGYPEGTTAQAGTNASNTTGTNTSNTTGTQTTNGTDTKTTLPVNSQGGAVPTTSGTGGSGGAVAPKGITAPAAAPVTTVPSTAKKISTALGLTFAP